MYMFIMTYVYRFVSTNHVKTDQQLEYYVEAVELITRIKVKTKMGFNNLKGEVTGKCYPKSFIFSKLNSEIVIDRKYWKNANFNQKIMLTMHELIHCECNIFIHKERILNDGCPSSIMNTTMPSKDCINKYMGEYLYETKDLCK